MAYSMLKGAIPSNVLDISSLVENVPNMRQLPVLNLLRSLLPPRLAIGNLVQVRCRNAPDMLQFTRRP